MDRFNNVYCLVTGQVPGIGSYLCKNCSIAIDIDEDDKRLPTCPCCEQQFFYPEPTPKSILLSEQALLS